MVVTLTSVSHGFAIRNPSATSGTTFQRSLAASSSAGVQRSRGTHLRGGSQPLQGAGEVVNGVLGLFVVAGAALIGISMY
jgi:hypothetical protein